MGMYRSQEPSQPSPVAQLPGGRRQLALGRTQKAEEEGAGGLHVLEPLWGPGKWPSPDSEMRRLSHRPSEGPPDLCPAEAQPWVLEGRECRGGSQLEAVGTPWGAVGRSWT